MGLMRRSCLISGTLSALLFLVVRIIHCLRVGRARRRLDRGEARGLLVERRLEARRVRAEAPCGRPLRVELGAGALGCVEPGVRGCANLPAEDWSDMMAGPLPYVKGLCPVAFRMYDAPVTEAG